MPVIATGVRLPWDDVVEDPVAALAEARRALGDTFVVDSGDDRYLFLFSPMGVAAFYGLPEEKASKGVADWRMLRRKLPDEVFAGRRVLPHQLFGREDVAAYLRNVELAVDAAVDELGSEGEVDLFSLSRRLGHRVGLASWGGPGCRRGRALREPGPSLRPARRLGVLRAPRRHGPRGRHGQGRRARRAGGGHRAARARAAANCAARTRRDAGTRSSPASSTPGPMPSRRRRPRESASTSPSSTWRPCPTCSPRWVGTWSISWSIPIEAEQVRRGDAGLAETCALESTRMAQRSIMARFTLAPFTIDLEEGPLEVPSGMTVATLLPLTNRSAAPGLDRWDPARWNRRRLRTPNGLAAAELVTVFGHGGHSCPARPFSLAAMTLTSRRLLGRFRWEPSWSEHPDRSPPRSVAWPVPLRRVAPATGGAEGGQGRSMALTRTYEGEGGEPAPPVSSLGGPLIDKLLTGNTTKIRSRLLTWRKHC